MKCNCCGQAKQYWICHRCLNVSPNILQRLYLDKLIEQQERDKLKNACNVILGSSSAEKDGLRIPVEGKPDITGLSLSKLRETLQSQLKKVNYWKIHRQCDKIKYYIDHLNGRIEQKRERIRFLESELLDKNDYFDIGNEEETNATSENDCQQLIDTFNRQLSKQRFFKFEMLNNWFNIMNGSGNNHEEQNSSMIMFHIPMISLNSASLNEASNKFTIPVILDSLFRCRQYVELVATIFDIEYRYDNNFNHALFSKSCLHLKRTTDLLQLSVYFENVAYNTTANPDNENSIIDDKYNKFEYIIEVIEVTLSQLILNMVKVCQELHILPFGAINLGKLIDENDISKLLVHIVTLEKIEYDISYSDCIWTLPMCRRYIKGKFKYNLQPQRKDRWFVVG